MGSSQVAVKPAPDRRPTLALAALSGLNLVNYIDRQVLPAVLPPLQRDLHLSDTQAGWLTPAFMLGYFVTAPVFGYLGDRMSRKGLIAAGVVVWCAGTLLTGIVSGLVELIVFRALVGFGEASFGTLGPSWIADLFPKARRNNALSFFYVAIPVGSALGQILGGLVASHSGWRSAFLWAGLPGLVIAALLLLLPEPARGESDSPAQDGSPLAPPGWSDYRGLLGHRLYCLVVAGNVAQTFAIGGFALWSATFLVRVHGMGLKEADEFFGLTLVVTGLVATVVGGLWATAWDRRNPAGSAWILAGSAVLCVPVVVAAFLTRDVLTAKVALAASMFLIFLPTGPTNSLILSTVPPAVRASAMAASIFAIHVLGDFWSPQLVGLLSDHFGGLEVAMLSLMPASLAVCAFFWTWLAVATPKAAAPA